MQAVPPVPTGWYTKRVNILARAEAMQLVAVRQLTDNNVVATSAKLSIDLNYNSGESHSPIKD